MKDLMVVPKPIFDRYKETKGYYFAYQIGNALIEGAKPISLENSMESPFFDFINEIGLEALTGNQIIFVPVTNVLLVTDIEESLTVDPANVALLLGKNIKLSETNLKRVAKFKDLGFNIAFRHHRDYQVLEPFLEYTDYIFCDNDPADITAAMTCAKKSRVMIKVIVSNINSLSDFDSILMFNADLYRGDFYTETRIINVDKPVSPLKINYLQLLNQANEEDFDFEDFAGIVQRDTALAVNFLKMVNSSSVVRSDKITSIKHAAALLGQKEIRKWVTSAVTTSLGMESPGEVTRLSMLRAKFCENLAPLFEMAIHKDNLFLIYYINVYAEN
jgi:EAL and modified HD-GYP domain-containing signal transduction protein